ncbi:hypothetical protein BDF21DRAFT_400132 [Thamnidium elegans]|nr:hypothetical protein BDF21DRAFT_400132 [Thamnidium elegans]
MWGIKTKKNLKVRGLQLAAIEGEILEIRLADNGLYAVPGLGSLRLPKNKDDVRRAKKLLKRLAERKRNSLALSHLFVRMIETSKDDRLCMPKKINVERSPESDSADNQDDSVTKYEDRVRGNWSPPPSRVSTAVTDITPPFLSPPPK